MYYVGHEKLKKHESAAERNKLIKKNFGPCKLIKNFRIIKKRRSITCIHSIYLYTPRCAVYVLFGKVLSYSNLRYHRGFLPCTCFRLIWISIFCTKWQNLKEKPTNTTHFNFWVGPSQTFKRIYKYFIETWKWGHVECMIKKNSSYARTQTFVWHALKDRSRTSGDELVLYIFMAVLQIIQTSLPQNYAHSAPPPKERSAAKWRGILYTNQVHNTHQMQAFLKDPTLYI